MKIEQSELKDLMAVVTIVIEPADYQEEVAKQLKEVRHKAQMPGFRPGMVPMGMIKKQYGTAVKVDEINKLMGKTAEKGFTLIPLEVYFKGSLVKVKVGLCRGKKLYDKREDMARKDQKRELERDFKSANIRV